MARTESEPELAGMGTTVTAILRAGNKLAMMHLGDSRGYLLRDGTLTQVTADHTFVQHLVDTGKITPEEAEHHPQRSVVMRVLGDYDTEITPDLSVREARPGDRWLLCSDGLSGFVSHETIEQTMAGVPDVDACADLLVQLALRAGGGDNVTVVVADVVELDAVRRRRRARRRPRPSSGRRPSIAQRPVRRGRRRRSPRGRASPRPPPTAAPRAATRRTGPHPPPSRRPRTSSSTSGRDPPGAHDDRLGRDRAARRRRRRRTWHTGGRRRSTTSGSTATNVAVFRGLPQDLGPISLSSVVEESDVAVDDLSAYLRDPRSRAPSR